MTIFKAKNETCYQQGKMSYQRKNSLPLVLSALFAGLTAVCSWINIPLFFTPVPVNLALIGPFMAGLLLGCKYGLISNIIYILIGALGLPVFAGFTGGIGSIIGPTGGFIIGYAACAFICGLAYGRLRQRRILSVICIMIAGLACCYCLGLIWFMFLTGSSLWAGLLSCVLPFLPGDACKITAAYLLSRQLSNTIKQI